MTSISPQTHASRGSAFVDFTDGLVSHGEAFFYMPGDLANYLLGVDTQWGERRSFFANVFRHYGSPSEGLLRPVRVVSGFAIGGFNFLTAGGLHTDTEFLREFSVFVFRNHPTTASLCNEFFRTAESYMNPPARNAYEVGQWTFDTVAAIAGYRVMVEYKAWSDPISKRTAIIVELQNNYRLSLASWVTELGGGDVAITKLRDMATRLPSLADKDIPAQLEMGNRAMYALGALARQYPQATAWMKNLPDLAPIANRLTEHHASIVESARLRLLVAAQYAPDGVIDAVVDSAMNRFQDPFLEAGVFHVIDHAASPHFGLLKLWESNVALRLKVLRAYQIIGMNSESFTISARAAEGIARMLPGSRDVVVELLNDSGALTRYTMMRALMRQHIAAPKTIPPELVARLQQFPLAEYMVLIGKEATTGDAYALALHAIEMGNESALRLVESMLEISHPHATIGLLRQISNVMPQHGVRISTFLKTVDTAIIENDVIFHVTEDPFMSMQNARLLVELAREGNVSAKDSLLRLSLNEQPKVMETAVGRLVDMAEAGVLTADEIQALTQDSGPRLLQLTTHAVLKNSTTVKIQWYSFSQSVLAVHEFPPEVIQVLRHYARLNDPSVGSAVSQFLSHAGKLKRDLIAILQEFPEVRKTVNWNHLAEVVNASLDDIGLQLEAVKLMDEIGDAAAVPLKVYGPQWFEGVGNRGDIQGLAGLEVLAINGNRAAIAALQRLGRQKHSPDQFYNIPFSARHALENLVSEVKVNDGAKPQPTIHLQVTLLDVQNGISAMMANEIMAGNRVVKSLRELELLKMGVEQGSPGALDAIYKVAWQKGEFSAEARELLQRWDASADAPHQATVHIMVHVLNQAEAPVVEMGSQSASVVAIRSLRHLESLITESAAYGGMAMEELIRQLRRNPDVLTVTVKRLLSSKDQRMLDLVAERLVVAAGGRRVSVGVLRTILEAENSSLGKTALQKRIAFELLTTSPSNPLEQLRPLIP